MASEISYEIEIKNLNLGTALSEKSLSFGEAKRVQIGCRDSNDQPVSFRLSHVSGGTIDGPYLNMFQGSLLFEADVRISQKLYFSSKTDGAVIEVLIWR